MSNKDERNGEARGRLLMLPEADDESLLAGSAQFRNIDSLTEEQAGAVKAIKEWLRQARNPDGKRIFTLSGYAGTGKSTTLGFLAADLTRTMSVGFCTLTAMASSVVRRSLTASGVTPAFCGTIHSMLYTPITDDKTGEVTSWERKLAVVYDLIVVDEASMVSKEILVDLMSLGIPILCVGDGGQLPPVGEDVGIMNDPDYTLRTVHRQAMDNPIIALSVAIREGQDWYRFVKTNKDPRVKHLDRMDLNYEIMEKFEGFLNRPQSEDPMVIVAYNNTRTGLNNLIRSTLKTDEKLVIGERITCLKNQYMNNTMLPNGACGIVDQLGYSPNPAWANVRATFLDQKMELRDGMICKAQFGQKTFKSFLEINQHYQNWRDAGMLFDYGYVKTGHKIQGQQGREGIILMEQMGTADDFKRWAYTAVTRCIETANICF